MTGAVLVLSAAAVHRRQGLTDRDYLSGSRQFAEIATAGLTDWGKALLPTKAAARAVYLKLTQPQPKLKTQIQVVAEQLLQDDLWFDEFVRRSKIVCGATGDGKTTLQLYEVAKFLEDHPDGNLIICDLDYGSSHEGSQPNYWFGLPKDRYICDTYELIRDAILAEAAEVERRAAAAREGKQQRWQWRMFAIDEAIAVFQEAKDHSGDEEKLTKALRTLLYRGLKQRCKITFGCQALEVSENGLSLAMQDQVNVILLGSSALKAKNLTRLGITDAPRLKERLERTRAIPGCGYAAIVQVRGVVDVRALPSIDLSTIIIDLPKDDELEQWWTTVFTPETQQWLYELAERHLAGEIKSPLKTLVCDRFGIQKQIRANSRYAKVADAWEAAKQKVPALKTAEKDTEQIALDALNGRNKL